MSLGPFKPELARLNRKLSYKICRRGKTNVPLELDCHSAITQEERESPGNY